MKSGQCRLGMNLRRDCRKGDGGIYAKSICSVKIAQLLLKQQLIER